MLSIDLNCDLGESLSGHPILDEQIFPLISSANIACGFHAGDPETMRRTVAQALHHKTAIGAHPGTADRQSFGRRECRLAPIDLENLLIYQIGALQAFCVSAGTRISHIKPHGWLYNAAATNREVAGTIVRVIQRLNKDWIVFGLAGSALIEAALVKGLPCAQEGFLDRTYEPDGCLTSRSIPGSLIEDPEVAAQQTISLVLDHEVQCRSGEKIRIQADTLCVHGDNPAAVRILQRIHELLAKHGVKVQSFRPEAARQ